MIDYFGPVQATIDEGKKQITLTLRRGREPQSDGFIANCKSWATSVTCADHPDYELVDETGEF